MDLFQEIRELEAAAEQYAEDDQNVSQWLSELLEIKKSRIALEVFMVDGKPEVVLYTCLSVEARSRGLMRLLRLTIYRVSRTVRCAFAGRVGTRTRRGTARSLTT